MKYIFNRKEFVNEYYGGLYKKDYITIGPVPTGEEAVQVSSASDYIEPMIAECVRYIEMLKKRFPNCTNIDIRLHQETGSDFGVYYEVAIYYNEEDLQEALFIEHSLPEKWTDTEVLMYDAGLSDEDERDEDSFRENPDQLKIDFPNYEI